MLHSVVLGVHIAAGVVGLAMGVPFMRAAVSGHNRTRCTVTYQAAVTVLTVTAIALATMDWPRLWPFAFIALATEAAVIGAWSASVRRFGGWLLWHVRLSCGSYLSLVTALLVVSWGSWLAWLIPTVVGAPLVERAAARAHLAQRREEAVAGRAGS